jgi:hypothetical protein
MAQRVITSFKGDWRAVLVMGFDDGSIRPLSLARNFSKKCEKISMPACHVFLLFFVGDIPMSPRSPPRRTRGTALAAGAVSRGKRTCREAGSAAPPGGQAGG